MRSELNDDLNDSVFAKWSAEEIGEFQAAEDSVAKMDAVLDLVGLSVVWLILHKDSVAAGLTNYEQSQVQRGRSIDVLHHQLLKFICYSISLGASSEEVDKAASIYSSKHAFLSFFK